MTRRASSIRFVALSLIVPALIVHSIASSRFAKAQSPWHADVTEDGAIIQQGALNGFPAAAVPGEYLLVHEVEPIAIAAARAAKGRKLQELSGADKVHVRSAMLDARSTINQRRRLLAASLARRRLIASRVVKLQTSQTSAVTVLHNLKPGDVTALIKEGYDIRPVERIPLTLHKSVPHIGAQNVWAGTDPTARSLTGHGVTVGVIDTGIDWSHPAFGSCTDQDFISGNCARVRGKNFVTRDSPPADEGGHGTHVAGIVGAGGAIPGVAPDVTLYALKACKDNACFGDAILAALEFAADPNGDGNFSDHLDVVNLSLGAAGGNPDDILSKAVDAVVAAGVVAVVAAGNMGPNEYTVTTPGTARSAITVGARSEISSPSIIDPNPKVALFSSRGPVRWKDKEHTLLKPDILAPGSAICAPRLPSLDPTMYPECASGYTKLYGTSMASPHVAGAAALVIQAHPDWSPSQVKSALLLTAEPEIDYYTGNSIELQLQGHGELRVDRAVLGNPRQLNISNTAALRGANVAITGTVLVPGLIHYIVSYRNSTANQFEELFRGNSQVENGTLGTLDPGQLQSGTAEFRLTAVTNSGSEHSYALLKIPNTEIESPFDMRSSSDPAFVRSTSGRSKIPVIGSASSSQFSHFTMQICSVSGLWCTSQGFSLTGNGQQPILNNTLGYFEPYNVPQVVTGEYQLKLTTYSQNGRADEVVATIYIDTDLAPLFPAENVKAVISSDGVWTRWWYLGSQPILDDLDGDGAEEIIFNYRGLVDVRNGRFESLPGWPRSIETSGNQTPVTVADMDGDGKKEIIATDLTPQRLYVFKLDGNLLPGYPRRFLTTPVDWKPHKAAPRTLADLNRDGLREVISPDLWTEDVLGNQVDGWIPKNLGSTPHEAAEAFSHGPAIGDLDGDGSIEVIATSFDTSTTNTLFVFNKDGTLRWKRLLTAASPSEPMLGDLDGDGRLEIVITDAAETYQKIFVFNFDGSPRAPWPYTIEKSALNFLFRTAPVSLGDLDGDGKDEIVHARGGSLFIFDGIGTLLTQIDPPPGPYPGAYQYGGHVTLANVDEDLDLEIIPTFGANGPLLKIGDTFAQEIFAFNRDGTIVTGFPKRLWGYRWNEHVPVGDIDGDGKNEMLGLANEFLYAWKTNGVITPDRGWKQDGGNAQRVRNVRFKNESVLRPAPPSTPSSTPQPDPNPEPTGDLSLSKLNRENYRLSWKGDSVTVTFSARVTPTDLATSVNGYVDLVDENSGIIKRQPAKATSLKDGEVKMRTILRFKSNSSTKTKRFAIRVGAGAAGLKPVSGNLGRVLVQGKPRRHSK